MYCHILSFPYATSVVHGAGMAGCKSDIETEGGKKKPGFQLPNSYLSTNILECFFNKAKLITLRHNSAAVVHPEEWFFPEGALLAKNVSILCAIIGILMKLPFMSNMSKLTYLK